MIRPEGTVTIVVYVGGNLPEECRAQPWKPNTARLNCILGGKSGSRKISQDSLEYSWWIFKLKSWPW